MRDSCSLNHYTQSPLSQNKLSFYCGRQYTENGGGKKKNKMRLFFLFSELAHVVHRSLTVLFIKWHSFSLFCLKIVTLAVELQRILAVLLSKISRHLSLSLLGWEINRTGWKPNKKNWADLCISFPEKPNNARCFHFVLFKHLP